MKRLNTDLKSHIRAIGSGIDKQKVLIASDDLQIYNYDLEKDQFLANTVFEGHSDFITDMTVFQNSTLFVTRSPN